MANNESGFYWYLKSAEFGLCLSQYEVAHSFKYGTLCSKDEEKALIWFKKAAKQGHTSSMKELKKKPKNEK